jgi:hypothetical protein
MASLSLQEAAEQAGTSKVDIWRAIQEGALAAQRMDDGGFAIDPAELFRVFERLRPNERPTGQHATAPPQGLGQPEHAASPETAAMNDIAVAFAALGVELKGLLEQAAKAPASDQPNERNDENCLSEQLDVVGDKADDLGAEAATGLEKANALIAETETPIPPLTDEKVAETLPKTPWWRRFVG